jgi:flagellar biosynthetic protein FliR
MLSISSTQIEALLGLYLWPFVRLGAFLMVAPLYGALYVPRRVRLVLALAIAVVLAPVLPAPPAIALLSIDALLTVAQQLLIGLASGFLLQLVFDAVGLGGQLLANTMGLSFAFNVDPQRGAATPALGRFYMVVATLTFLALDGHLRLVELLVDSFRGLPVGAAGFGSQGLWHLLEAAGLLFSGAVAVALPGVTALLVVNIGFGVMSRAAPALNLFAIGFPLILLLGLAILLLGLPAVQSATVDLTDRAIQTLAEILGGSG